MKKVKIKVKNCKNCPFCEANFNPYSTKKILHFATCLSPLPLLENNDITTYYKNYKSPKWCPLNNTTIIISK